MKIDTVVVTRQNLTVDITPKEALQSLRDEIVRRMNRELESLKLPKRELYIPRGGFHTFFVEDATDKIVAYHEEGRHPRETITQAYIKWGGDRFKRMVAQIKQLKDIQESDTFSH